MADLHTDQAAGLRRLFGRGQPHIVTFAAGSPGVGKSVTVANVAAALARQGKEVLVFDENTNGGIAALYGAAGRHELQHVLNREKTLSEVVLEVAAGVRILPAARAVGQLSKLNASQQEALFESLGEMALPPDVILVDASLDHPLGFSPLGLAAHDTVVVVSATGASITEAYALIKKVSLGYALQHFRILVNRVRSSREAAAIHDNIARLTRSRGLARLDYAGFVPIDDQLHQASRRGQPVVGLFPEAPSAQFYRKLAGDLLAWPFPDQEPGGLEQFVQQLLHVSRYVDPVAIRA